MATNRKGHLGHGNASNGPRRLQHETRRHPSHKTTVGKRLQRPPSHASKHVRNTNATHMPRSHNARQLLHEPGNSRAPREDPSAPRLALRHAQSSKNYNPGTERSTLQDQVAPARRLLTVNSRPRRTREEIPRRPDRGEDHSRMVGENRKGGTQHHPGPEEKRAKPLCP